MGGSQEVERMWEASKWYVLFHLSLCDWGSGRSVIIDVWVILTPPSPFHCTVSGVRTQLHVHVHVKCSKVGRRCAMTCLCGSCWTAWALCSIAWMPVRLPKLWWVIQRLAMPVTMGHSQQVPYLLKVCVFFTFYTLPFHILHIPTTFISSFFCSDSQMTPHHLQWHHNSLPSHFVSVNHTVRRDPPLPLHRKRRMINVLFSFRKSRFSNKCWLVTSEQFHSGYLNKLY